MEDRRPPRDVQLVRPLKQMGQNNTGIDLVRDSYSKVYCVRKRISESAVREGRKFPRKQHCRF